jgi:glycine/D-amino acid oxidase-like deaminating enzyme
MWDQVDPVFSPSTFFSQLTTPSKWRLDDISPFENNRILEPEIRHNVLDAVAKDLVADFPIFSKMEERERWAGVLVSTLDNMPVISAADALPGLYLGTGFYYGLTMAPAAGEALADLATGKTPKLDLSLYRHSRFTDGSSLTFRA